MAPTTNMTKPVATAIATFVSIDKFIIFPFNYGGTPRRPLFFGSCVSHIASNFGVLMDARRSARFSATRERGKKKGESALTRWIFDV
jgi:hypothetical protein